MVATKSVLTFEDLMAMPEENGKRYELLGGELYVSASPSRKHVWIASRLGLLLGNHVAERDLGMVFTAPGDIRFSDVDVVVPDIFFLSTRRMKIYGDQFVDGAPDLVVEILSPSTRLRDLNQKRVLYETRGVSEYWIVDLENQSISVLSLSADGRYEHVPPEGDRVVSPVLPELELLNSSLFHGL